MQVTKFRALMIIAAAALAAPPAIAAAPKIAAHKAFYQFELKPGRESNLLSASGRMAYEVAGSSCEGWTVNYRLVNDFKPAEGAGRVVDSISTSYETGDGLSFRYAQKEYVNNRLDSEKKLSVDREPGKEGTVKATLPKPEEFALDATAVFPMQHQIRMMTVANAGESRDSSIVFDGGDGAKTYRVITFIGEKKAVEVETAKGDATSLAKLSAWPVSISYFPNGALEPGESQDTPLYQVNFDMFENGVAQNLLLDYGDFALAGKLVDYVAGTETACD